MCFLEFLSLLFHQSDSSHLVWDSNSPIARSYFKREHLFQSHRTKIKTFGVISSASIARTFNCHLRLVPLRSNEKQESTSASQSSALLQSFLALLGRTSSRKVSKHKLRLRIKIFWSSGYLLKSLLYKFGWMSDQRHLWQLRHVKRETKWRKDKNTIKTKQGGKPKSKKTRFTKDVLKPDWISWVEVCELLQYHMVRPLTRFGHDMFSKSDPEWMLWQSGTGLSEKAK